MKVRALEPLNHNDKTVNKGEIIEIENKDTVKKLIDIKAVEEVKEIVVPTSGANMENLEENKTIGDKK